MSSSNLWNLKQGKTFQSQLKKFIKKYYKKNAKGEKKFLSLLRDIINQLSIHPNIPNSRLEPAPKGSLKEHEELRKFYFHMPNYKGSSSQGRIMYKVDKQKREIILICIYTHQDFEKRPSDKEIRRLLDES